MVHVLNLNYFSFLSWFPGIPTYNSTASSDDLPDLISWNKVSMWKNCACNAEILAKVEALMQSWCKRIELVRKSLIVYTWIIPSTAAFCIDSAAFLQIQVLWHSEIWLYSLLSCISYYLPLSGTDRNWFSTERVRQYRASCWVVRLEAPYGQIQLSSGAS